MLPPKVARMMVNIGLCSYLDSNNATPTVFDPFCGSGTVLTEALQLGCNVKGSDSSDKAITDTRANIEWLIQSNLAKLDHTVYTFPKAAAEPELFVSESVHVTKVVGQSTIDVIVTEPYMGPTFLEDPTPGKRERIMKGLEKLYIGTLKELYRALKPGGVLVFAEPEYFMEGKSFKIGIIDKYADFGYTKSCNFVSYKRDRSFVGRRIAILKKV
jgi:tRNA G10  N-methylase Trm11